MINFINISLDFKTGKSTHMALMTLIDKIPEVLIKMNLSWAYFLTSLRPSPSTPWTMVFFFKNSNYMVQKIEL